MKELTRRDLLKNVVAASVATAAMASGVASASSGHQHHQSNPNTAIVDSALDCLKTGQACLDHCMQSFKKGDTTLADCADQVNELLAACTALSQMASYQSKHLVEFARVCSKVCNDCMKACEKHADKHAECKTCAKSCKDCIEACDKITA